MSSHNHTQDHKHNHSEHDHNHDHSGHKRWMLPSASINPEMPVLAARANDTRFSTARKTTIEKC